MKKQIEKIFLIIMLIVLLANLSFDLVEMQRRLKHPDDDWYLITKYLMKCYEHNDTIACCDVLRYQASPLAAAKCIKKNGVSNDCI